MTPFQLELRANIRAYIRQAQLDGTQGMSIANLKQCVKTPRATEGAPMGTNAQWVYAQMFREACKEIKSGFFIVMD